MEQGFDPSARAKLALHTTGHFTTDLYGGFLAALFPVLVRRFGLTMTMAGGLASAERVTSSLVQPLSGYIFERPMGRWVMALGPLLGALFMSLLGWTSNYAVLLALFFTAGLGAAFFHPRATASAGEIGGQGKGLVMAIFGGSRTAGIALAPFVILPVVSAFGLKNTWLVAIPGLIMAVLLYRGIPLTKTVLAKGANLGEALGEQLKPFSLVWLIAVLQGTRSGAYVSFLPILLVRRGFSLLVAGASVSLFGIPGVLGSLALGYLADKVGSAWVVLMSFLLAIPLPHISLRSSGVLIAVSLFLGGAALLSSVPQIVVIAQELMPTHTAVASALIMGFAWGASGLGVTLVGILADAIGMIGALSVAVWLPLVAFLIALSSPALRRGRTS